MSALQEVDRIVSGKFNAYTTVVAQNTIEVLSLSSARSNDNLPFAINTAGVDIALVNVTDEERRRICDGSLTERGLRQLRKTPTEACEQLKAAIRARYRTAWFWYERSQLTVTIPGKPADRITLLQELADIVQAVLPDTPSPSTPLASETPRGAGSSSPKPNHTPAAPLRQPPYPTDQPKAPA